MNSTTGPEPSSALILSTTSIVTTYLCCLRRSPSSAISRHCSSALMASQRPSSAPVRTHPMQYPRSPREQILMQGEGGRSGGAARAGASVTLESACVELWGCLAYSSNAEFWPQVNRNNNLETEANESPEQPSTVPGPRRRHSRGAHAPDRRLQFQRAGAGALVPHRRGCVLDRPALLLQRCADPGARRCGCG